MVKKDLRKVSRYQVFLLSYLAIFSVGLICALYVFNSEALSCDIESEGVCNPSSRIDDIILTIGFFSYVAFIITTPAVLVVSILRLINKIRETSSK